VSDEARVALTTSLVTFVFMAGGFYVWVRLKISQLQKSIIEKFDDCMRQTRESFGKCMNDINGVASRDRENSRDERRHYHNVTMALLVAAPLDKETEITKLLKEEGADK
jgi:hypothetical protein